MVRYSIAIATGDPKKIKRYYFVHEDWAHTDKEISDKKFDEAVKELDHIYENYGRFATSVGVRNLFKAYGFDETISD